MTDVVDGPSKDPQPGDIVRHYKGGFYVVLFRGQREEDGAVVVIYCNAEEVDPGVFALDGTINTVWVRPLLDWAELVPNPTDCGGDGLWQPRYRLVSSSPRPA